MSPRKAKTLPEGTMAVVFGEYLRGLEKEENQKPLEQRRRVPSIEELASELKLHPVTLRNIANNNIKKLDLETAASAIKLMRRLGFAMRDTDFVRFIEPEGDTQA
jgi:DNA-binding transcriptional regulator YhcF (GntR family)